MADIVDHALTHKLLTLGGSCKFTVHKIRNIAQDYVNLCGYIETCDELNVRPDDYDDSVQRKVDKETEIRVLINS